MTWINAGLLELYKVVYCAWSHYLGSDNSSKDTCSLRAVEQHQRKISCTDSMFIYGLFEESLRTRGIRGGGYRASPI